MNFRDKKVLVMGLGSFGGGIAAAKWLVRHGARVTVTDTRTKKELARSIKALGPAAKKIAFVLGGHRKEDFETHDVIVVNPAVPRESEYLAAAKKRGKLLVNDARIFFDAVKNPVVAVTGTRGKTTTTNWTAHFLKTKDAKTAVGGNSSDVALLNIAERLKSAKTPAVVELSSWQLELLPGAKRAPDVAVITNLYPDHLNRYRRIGDYASAKANIFKGQAARQKLVLNYDNPWTKFFLKQKPESSVFFFSFKPLPRSGKGVFLKNGSLFFRAPHSVKEVIPKKIVASIGKRGEHNLANFMAASLAAHLMGVSWPSIARSAESLPQIRYREEIVLKKKNFTAVNDSAATSPDAVIAAIKRFAKRGNVFLITGGTDKNLDFKSLAREIKGMLPPGNVFFLNGSATKKLLTELKKLNYFKKGKLQTFEDLELIAKKIKTLNPNIVLFSPGAASFEKFKNEFDRGERFDRYVKEYFRYQ